MFGQPSFGGFGQAQSQPAFGASPSSSPFGGTSAFGAQPSPFGAPATGTGVFGASQPAFGAATGAGTPAFGAQQSQGGLFGGTAFGAKPAGGFSFGSSTPAFGGATSQPAFGAAQSAGAFGAFGASSTPAFGAAASTPAFGAAATTPAFGGFGSTTSTPAFGAAASSTPAFGTPGGSAGFGTPGSAFGGTPGSSGFGTPAAPAAPAAPQQPGMGSRRAPYQKFQDKETGTTGAVNIIYNSITAMPAYQTWSFEELRCEDYAAGVKNASSAPPPAAPAFGGPATSSPATGFGFGASSTPAFGAAGTGSVFGASAPAPFGAASTPAFGGSSPSPFGGFGSSTPAASQPAFGGFGASAPSAGGGLFGAAAAPAASSPFGGFGASSGSAFGATSTPAFGASSTPAFGGSAFGAPSSGGGLFGGSSTPAFGAGGFGSATPAFGAPAASSPFGAPAPAAGAFGAPPSSSGFSFSSPAASKAAGFSFAPSSGGGLFGAASTGSTFGAASAPAFGASTGGGLFGLSAAPPSGGSLFGGNAFGAAPAAGGGLFGGGAAAAPAGGAFSFAPQGGTPGAFGAAGAAPVQPPGVGQQPYGALQPLPQVNVPDQAPLNQRPVRPSVTSTRPSQRLAARTALPKFGVAGANGGMARGAGVGRNAAVNSAYVLSGSPTASTGGSPIAAALLPARDNPHRLFVRQPPPSTAAAANGSSLSPARAAGGQAGADEEQRTPVRTPPQQQQQQRSPRSAERQPPEAPVTNGLHHSPAAAHGTPQSGGKGATPAAAAAAAGGGEGGGGGGVAPHLGRLRDEGYSMKPSERELQSLAARDPSSVHSVRLVVEREGYGKLEWLQPVDVGGLSSLEDVVLIDRGMVSVYGGDEDSGYQKPPVGVGLNRPCRVVLSGVYKKNVQQSDPAVIRAFNTKLQRYCNDMGAKFVSYEPVGGVWTFEVDHFSRYGVPLDSDDEDDGAAGQQDNMDATGSGAQGAASQEEPEPTLGFGDADMQAEADDAGTLQQREEAAATAAGLQGPALQHSLPGLLGHDLGSLMEQKQAFFRRGGAAAGSDEGFVPAAAVKRLTAVTALHAAAASPSTKKPRGACGGRESFRAAAGAGDARDDQMLDDAREEFSEQVQSLQHNWARKRPALLQQPRTTPQQQQQQQQDLMALVPVDEALQGAGAGPLSPPAAAAAKPGAGAALLVRPLSPQNLPSHKHRAATAAAAASSPPLLPGKAAVASSAAVVDASLMLGRSFRVGWGPNGQLVVPTNPLLNPPSSGGPQGQAQQEQQQQQLTQPYVQLQQLNPIAAVANSSSRSRARVDHLQHPAVASCLGLPAAAAAAAARTGMQQRVLSGLQLHLDGSVSSEDEGWQLACDNKQLPSYVQQQLSGICEASAAAAAVAAASAARDGDEGGMDDGTAAAAAAEASVTEAAGCSEHTRQLWQLLQLLFEYVDEQDDVGSGQDASSEGGGGSGNSPNGRRSAAPPGSDAAADAEMEAADGEVLPLGGSGSSSSSNARQLAAMRRKAALSRWLQAKLCPQVMGALQALQEYGSSSSSSVGGELGDRGVSKAEQQQERDKVMWAVLHLMAGRQVKAAVALAASLGDVRLSTLLSSVNTPAQPRHAQQLQQQLQVWGQTSILPHFMHPPRSLLLALLTAAAPGGSSAAAAAGGQTEQALVDVANALGLDWSGVLGLWLWYKVPFIEPLSSTTTAFTTALTALPQLARPVPPHAGDPAVLLLPEQQAQTPQNPAATAAAAAAEAAVSGKVAAAADTQYALLQLCARGCRNLGTALLNTGAATATAAAAAAAGGSSGVDVESLVCRLLRPSGHTVNPLDHSTAWQLLQVLRALGVMPEEQEEYESAACAVSAGLISQLLLLGPEAVPWVAFVALHIPNAAHRSAALQQLLQVTAPTWAADAGVVCWLRDTLGLPLAWMHTAQAVWYGSNQHTTLQLLHLIAAGSWQEAHMLACSHLLPLLALATIPAASLAGGSSSSRGAAGGSVARQVLAVLEDFDAAAAAFMLTVGAAEAAAAAGQVNSGSAWQAPEDWMEGEDEDGSDGSSSARMQAYCVAAAAYVATASQAAAAAAGPPGDAARTAAAAAAAAAAPKVAGVTLRALCEVFAAVEGSLGSAWTLGAAVYGLWARAFLGRSGGFEDPALTAMSGVQARDEAAFSGMDVAGEEADGTAEGWEQSSSAAKELRSRTQQCLRLAGTAEGWEQSSSAAKELRSRTQQCLRLADLLADAAAAMKTVGEAGAPISSWWSPAMAQLVHSGMTATVGRTLVRLGRAGKQQQGAGQQQQQQLLGTGRLAAAHQGYLSGGVGGDAAGVSRGLLLTGSQSAGQPVMLAAAAVSAVGA